MSESLYIVQKGADGAKIRIAEQFYRVVNPGCEVPAEGVLVHKLRPNDVGQGVSPEQALSELREFIEGKVLVGHFLNIDLNVLRKRAGGRAASVTQPRNRYRARASLGLENSPYREDPEQQLTNVSLAALAKTYNLDFHEAHHALEDAFVTARLWQKQLAKLEAMKITSLGARLRIANA